MRRLSFALLAVALLARAPSAFAQVSPTEKAMAETLFGEGKALMDQHKWAEAIEKFKASERVEPAWGTSFNLAYCHEQLGKTATAWVHYKAALAHAKKKGREDRVQQANGKIAELEPKLSRIEIVVPVASKVPGIEVRVDGVGVDSGAWGSAVPFDPGTHVVVVTAPGRQEWRATVQLGNSEKKAVSVPELKVAAGPVSDPARDKDGVGGPSRTVPLIVGGVGVALMVAGGVVLYRAYSMRSEAEDLHARHDPEAFAKEGSASSQLTWSRVLLGAGAVATGVGVYLWTSSKNAPQTAVGLSVSGGPSMRVAISF